MSTIIQHTLDNGMRMVLEPMDHLPSAACGFLVRTGARDEPPQIEGVSHFLEHMCFKGTATHTWRELAEKLDALGANYNAYTSEERTFYYGWVPAALLNAQTELLADMLQPALPEDEFNTEKNVILEEIAQHRDSLESCMFELACKQLFKGHPLERSVLGTRDTIEPLQRSQMAEYLNARYHAANIIFLATGRFQPDSLIRQLDLLTRNWRSSPPDHPQPRPTIQNGTASQKLDRFKQQAIMCCCPMPPGCAGDPRPSAIAKILGGNNSRIYWNVIQEGICPEAGAFLMEYEDTSVLVLYALCQPERCDEVVNALRTQAANLQQNGPTESEIQRIHARAKASLAAAADQPQRRLKQLVDDVDLTGKPLSLQQHLQRIEQLSPGTIRQTLDQYPIDRHGMIVSVGPCDWQAIPT